MTPNPNSDAILKKVPTDIVGEYALRLIVTERHVRPDTVLTEGTTYLDLPISNTLKPDVNLWGHYILIKVTDGPEGYHSYWFGKPKTEAEKLVPYKTIPGAKHYDWPTVLHAIAFADDAEFPVTEIRPGNRSVKVPRKRARAVKTESVFALCKTETRYYLSPTKFDIPPHPQPTPSEVVWVVNGQEDRLVCLHDDLTLPARGSSWNLTDIQGDVTDVGIPSKTRTFPATPLTEWQPFTLDDNQRELETGHYLRTKLIIFPPPTADRSSL